jgi:two-component system response regulator TtrR
MKDKSKIHIYVVDDDTCLLDAINLFLKKEKFECVCFENADDCLNCLRQQKSCDLIITDIQMPDKSGLELLDEVTTVAPWVPVLVMTSYGDIPLAVKAVKKGAFDFIEKPLQWKGFLDLILSIVQKRNLSNLLKGKPLTNMEKITLQLILQNKTNKEIAGILHRSIRTIEVHRNHIMHKLDVRNIVDLVKRTSAMDLDETS